jgi:hypothetical protein
MLKCLPATFKNRRPGEYTLSLPWDVLWKQMHLKQRFPTRIPQRCCRASAKHRGMHQHFKVPHKIPNIS